MAGNAINVNLLLLQKDISTLEDNEIGTINLRWE